MPRAKKEAFDSAIGTASGLEGAENEAGRAAYVNGVEVSGFDDETYSTRSEPASTFTAPTDTARTDAETWTVDPTPAEAPKRRGPKPGYKKKPKPGATASPKIDLAIDKLTQGVAFIHCALANAMHIPELEMGVEESGAVVTATVDVLSQYDLTPDPKTAAWMNLAMVLATVYGTRVMAYQTRIGLAKNQTVDVT